jgi:hypothetical protein
MLPTTGAAAAARAAGQVSCRETMGDRVSAEILWPWSGKGLKGGLIKDRFDQDRLAQRFERFTAVA